MLKPLTLMARNNSGMSVLEMIPILVMFSLLLNYTLGFFGAIHSGTVNSIAARNYTFETFRQRANLTYLRDDPDWARAEGPSSLPRMNYTKVGFRFHGVAAENRADNSSYVATQRTIKFSDINSGSKPELNLDLNARNSLASSIRDGVRVSGQGASRSPQGATRQQSIPGQRSNADGRGVDPVWLMILYGICLNSDCRKPAYIP